MSSGMIAAAALGLPFTLGMLYDARRDLLIPGFTLWNEQTLQENTVESFQHSSTFAISACDSVESKSTLLDVGGSLKASFLCGLIEVGGSARYLNDQRKSHRQSRVTCQYHATTSFKQLSVIELDTEQPRQSDMVSKGFVTHVVTGILYGANAFFVFDSETLESGSVQDVQGGMQAVIRKIPSFSIGGSVDIKLTDEEAALTRRFFCTFYGDFLLESNPATFEDAVKTYAQFPQLIGSNGVNGVPLRVWLMPLKSLYSDAAELTREISVALVSQVQETLEDLRRLEIRCSDSLEEVNQFPPIQEQLSTFKKLCGLYAIRLKQSLAEKLPSFREGKVSHEDLSLSAGAESPFSREKLSRWLDHKEREINVVRSCAGIMQRAKVVLSQSELDREVLAGVAAGLCYVFTSLKNTDPFLDQMANHLDPGKESGAATEDQWCFSHEVVTEMRRKANYFNKMHKGMTRGWCFLIATMANEKYTGATVYYYNDGLLAKESVEYTTDLMQTPSQTE